MSRIYSTKEGDALYKEGSQSRIELKRNYHVKKFMCKLSVNHTNTSAVLKHGGLLRLINSIQIVANGNETIKNIPIVKCEIEEVVTTGKKGLRNVQTTDGIKDSYVWVAIYCAIPYLERPADTILNSAVYSTFNMLINWATASAVGTGIVINSAKIDVYSEALTNYVRNPNENIKHYKENYTQKDITVTASQFMVSLPTMQMYKSITLLATVDGVASNAVINKITLKSGTTVIVELDAQALKASNYDDFECQNALDLDGTYIIDFLTRNRLSDLLDTTNGVFNTLELVLDVTKQTGVNTLEIFSDTIEILNAFEAQPSQVATNQKAQISNAVGA